MPINRMLNVDDFVRIIQETGEEIVGRYDGIDYTFPVGAAVDVGKEVAQHIFGFGLPEESTDPRVQDKSAALTRLGWLANSQDRKAAMAKLRMVRFEEIPPFPTMLRLKRTEEDSGQTQVEIPGSVNAGALVNAVGEGTAASSGGPQVPRQTLHLKGRG